MVDFHTHILPGIDDGSKDTDMSVEMLREDLKQGIDTFVFTPHFYANYNTPEEFLEDRRKSFDKLYTAIKENELNPTIFLGAEVHYFSKIGRVDEIRSLAIENTDTMLLEPPFRKFDNAFYDDVENLVSRQGLTVVIAHIERYVNIFNAENIINTLHSCGAYVQCNASIFIEGGLPGRKAIQLYKKGKIDVLGSDCHNMSGRKPNIAQAVNILIQSGGKNHFENFSHKAYKLLNI